jgi:hypothetical protein
MENPASGLNYYFFILAVRRRINYFRVDILSRCGKRLQDKKIYNVAIPLPAVKPSPAV